MSREPDAGPGTGRKSSAAQTSDAAKASVEQTNIETASISWDEHGQPQSDGFGDVYFSRHNGLAETNHVFLQHNDLARRFAQHSGQQPFVIGETGFGCGLNFLAAWQLWNSQAPDGARLHFVSVERFPLNPNDLNKALSLWPELANLAQPLLAAYPVVLHPGIHRLDFGSVALTLILDDAVTGLGQLLASHHPQHCYPFAHFAVDAWFLDGFAPAKNPDMWQPQLFTTLALLSKPGTTLATFTAAGIVKRGLAEAGFSIEKVPGFGKKREMIKGVKSDTQPTPVATHYKAPLAWACSAPTPTPTKVAVIGAGLAGCTTAAALAKRGLQVHLYDRHPAPAAEASGNPQGVVYAKLSAQPGNQGDFNCLALLFAQRFYQPIWQSTNQPFGAQCGVLQLATGRQASGYQALIKRLGEQRLVQWQDNETASVTANTEVTLPGLFFPQSGWLRPQAICQALSQHNNITSFYNTSITALSRAGEGWQLAVDDGGCQEEYHYQCVVVACANHSVNLTPTAHLPLKPVRGQVTLASATNQSTQLQTVVCSEGYIAPSEGGTHCLGATFDPNDTDLNPRPNDQLRNIDTATAVLPRLHQAWPSPPTQWPSRVALRATTPDYLPIVGPVADVAATEHAFASLRRNARQPVASTGQFLPGLFVNVGHGSRGLTYTPLAAELLAAHILKEPPPLGLTLNHALNPARFIIRELIRNQR